MPFLNIHCPLDEKGRRVMQETVDGVLARDAAATLDDLVQTVAGLPAAERAETDVMVHLGEPENRAGKTVVAHGALTNGGYHVARAYFEHGVDTVIYIHVSPEDLKRLQEHDEGQLIVTGHVVGDAFGIEPMIQELRAQGVEVDVLSQILAPEGEGIQ
jgi:methionine aminopeptidase